MGFAAFVKFALICFEALAWPIFALGYPLLASIRAIEANSNPDTKKIVTYWVIFSLISLFENAFLGLLQWLPFWPYMKLTFVCWLMIPGFDGAFYVYNHFVHPCLYMDVQTIIKWFKKQQEFLLKDNFLAEADKYVKANGPEALEKPIARETNGREPSMLQENIKPVQEMVMEDKEIAAVNTAQANMLTVARPEIKETTCLGLPEIPSDKQVQKEWTCALCQITTSCEQNLKMHLQGRRHKATSEELTKTRNQRSKAKVSLDSVPVKDSKKEAEKRASCSSTAAASQKKHQPSKVQVSAAYVAKDSDLPKSDPQKCANSNGTHISCKAENPTSKPDLPKEKRNPQKCATSNGTHVPSKAVNHSSNGNKPDTPKEEPTKFSINSMAGNQVNPRENVQWRQQIGKNNLPFRCTICNIGCARSEDLNCHLWGKKHKARIQELHKLGQGEIA